MQTIYRDALNPLKTLSHTETALISLLLIIASAAPRHAIAGTIVTTIKPLYSLVSHLTAGVDEPTLLIQQQQDPHHYSMRPSSRRLLANAEMIIWVGPQMESYLSKVIEQQKKTATVVSALQAPDLQLLNKRFSHNHEEHEHSEENIDTASTGTPKNIDPHIWLSTHNAIAISKHITQQLIIFNPGQAEQYNKNLQTLIEKIEQTRQLTKMHLASAVDNIKTPFIAYHDAFQYYEEENALNHINSINFNDETGTSLKHLREIKTLIEKHSIRCLVYQAPKPAIIKKLVNNTSIKSQELDPLGVSVTNNKEAWFELMTQLTLKFSSCLNANQTE